MAIHKVRYLQRKPAPKTMDYDGLCFPGHHVFNDTCAGLIHPYWSKEQFLPVKFCVHCGLLKIELQEPIKGCKNVRKMRKKT